MDFENKKDEEVVEIAGAGTGPNSQGAQAEMTRRLKKSMNFSSGVMMVLNIILLFMTLALIWYARIQVAPIVNEITRKNQQQVEQCKHIDPNYEVPMTDGGTMKCSEFIKKFGE